MRRLLMGAVVAVVCAGAPAASRAETPVDVRSGAGPAAPYFLARPASTDLTASGDETSDYAKREQASPQLAEFSGGADGVYITSGAIAVALAIVLLLVLL